MALISKKIVKDAQGNEVTGLYELKYSSGQVSYTRNFQKDFNREIKTYSKNQKAKAIKDQKDFLKSKPELAPSKIKKYLDNLLKQKGPLFVNQKFLATELNVPQTAISKEMSSPKYKRIKVTRTDLPADYAKARGQDGKAFVKYLKDNNISNANWLKDDKGGNFRPETFQKFKAGVKESERIKAIPKGYISEQDLSELIYGNEDRVSFGEKISEGNRRYNSELAKFAKLLKPIKGKSPVNFNEINYYKKPNASELKKLIATSLNVRQKIQPKTLDNIKIILKDKPIANLFKNFSSEDQLPSWDRMKQIYTKQGLTPPSDNTMARTVAQISRILQGKGRLGTEGINLEKNARAGTLLVKKMFSGSTFGNAWSTAAQQEIYNIIDEKLGRESGTFENFKYRLKNIIREEGIPLYQGAKVDKFGNKIPGTAIPGFNLNEVLGTRTQFKNKAYPYTQFVDLAEGEFNQKQLNGFQRQLGKRQKEVIAALKNNNVPEAKRIIREFRDIRETFVNDFKNANVGNIYISKEYADDLGKSIGGSYKGDTYTKKLSQLYKKMDLENWKNTYGLDLESYGRKAGVNLDVAGGKPIEQVLSPAYRKTLTSNLAIIRKEFENNTNNVCSIFGSRSFERGGDTGGCGGQFDEAVEKNPTKLLSDVAESNVGSNKVKGMAQRMLTIFPKLGTVGKIATVAAGTGLALSGLRFNPEKGEIVTTDNDQKADQNQILQYVKDNPLKVTAGSSLGFAAQEVPGAYKAARDLGRGRVRSTLGISGAIRPVLTTFGTPLLTGLYEGAIGAKRLEDGETMTDILTDPVGPALGLTLMEPLSKLSGVVKNAPKRTMLEGARNYFNLSNVGAARPGITGQILRMGMSPRMIAGASRFLGLPGLALGLGMSGYDAYKNYQNQEGMIYNLFNKDG